MLSKEDKQKIRRLQSYHCSIKEVKGKPVTDDGKPFIIPSYPELLAKAIADIEELGFANVVRTSPNKANCIVRVFSTEHHKYNTELTYNLFHFLHQEQFDVDGWVRMQHYGHPLWPFQVHQVALSGWAGHIHSRLCRLLFAYWLIKKQRPGTFPAAASFFHIWYK